MSRQQGLFESVLTSAEKSMGYPESPLGLTSGMLNA